jgi:hypothetical protein
VPAIGSFAVLAKAGEAGGPAAAYTSGRGPRGASALASPARMGVLAVNGRRATARTDACQRRKPLAPHRAGLGDPVPPNITPTILILSAMASFWRACSARRACCGSGVGPRGITVRRNRSVVSWQWVGGAAVLDGGWFVWASATASAADLGEPLAAGLSPPDAAKNVSCAADHARAGSVGDGDGCSYRQPSRSGRDRRVPRRGCAA